jgi:hypothetical protein
MEDGRWQLAPSRRSMRPAEELLSGKTGTQSRELSRSASTAQNARSAPTTAAVGAASARDDTSVAILVSATCVTT